MKAKGAARKIVAVDPAGERMLEESAARTRDRRKHRGLDPVTGRCPGVPSLGASLMQVEPNTMAAVQIPDRSVFDASFMPPRGAYRCLGVLADGARCEAILELPGACKACDDRAEALKRRAEIAARIEATLPPLFRPPLFPEVTWENLPSLKNKSGTGHLIAVPAARLPAIRREIEENHISVIIGPTGAGKSFVAAAHVRARLEAGEERVAFVPAILLDEDQRGTELFERALLAQFVVIDDLGAELHGAPKDGGIASMRVKMTSKLLGLLYNQGTRLVITTPHEDGFLSGFYGEGNVRKLFDASKKIYVGQ
jgi:hypothetical protein